MLTGFFFFTHPSLFSLRIQTVGCSHHLIWLHREVADKKYSWGGKHDPFICKYVLIGMKERPPHPRMKAHRMVSSPPSPPKRSWKVCVGWRRPIRLGRQSKPVVLRTSGRPSTDGLFHDSGFPFLVLLSNLLVPRLPLVPGCLPLLKWFEPMPVLTLFLGLRESQLPIVPCLALFPSWPFLCLPY